MNIWLISDLHFGMRNNNLEWYEIQKNYFENFFIPLLNEKSQPGDILFILGDVFDSRNHINIRTMNFALTLISSLCEILPVHILCGNHDIFSNSTNDITSLKMFESIKNVKVYLTPKTLNLGGLNVGILPWMDGAENESNQIREWGGLDLLFCHSEVQGAMYNNFTKIEHGTTVDLYKDIKVVFSGHIHKPQQIKNIRFLGSPYQLTDGERDNKNAVLKLNLDNLSGEEYPNTISPVFKHLSLKEVQKIGLKNLQKDFIKIEVNESEKTLMQKLMKSEDISKRCSFTLIENDLEVKENDDEIQITDNLDFVESFKKFINDTKIDNKERFVEMFKKTFDNIN